VWVVIGEGGLAARSVRREGVPAELVERPLGVVVVVMGTERDFVAADAREHLVGDRVV
jgi:hypothetical protein